MLSPTSVLVALAVAILASGCSRSRTARNSDVRVVGGSEVPASIKLTPQTIVIRDGPRAVRSLSDDGATVTLDGVASGASDIKAGQ